MSETRVHAPVNEFGKPLVPVGTPRDKSSVYTNETIDVSWLPTIDRYVPDLKDADSKLVLYSALKSAVEFATTTALGHIKFKVCPNGESELPQEITEDTIAELRATIFLVPAKQSNGENQYAEYVCLNTDEYSEETKQPVKAEYEEIGSLNYELQQANESRLGGVKLLDEPDETKTANAGYAATPRAIYDLKQQIRNKSASFIVNSKTISDGDSITISASSPLKINTSGDGNVTILFSIADASDTQKGVLKLYSSTETASTAEDGSLTAKVTLEEIKKVENKISQIPFPKIFSQDQPVVDGKITIEQSDIYILSVFINDEQFYPQVKKTETSHILTFFEEGDPNYSNGTQATIFYAID